MVEQCIKYLCNLLSLQQTMLSEAVFFFNLSFKKDKGYKFLLSKCQLLTQTLLLHKP